VLERIMGFGEQSGSVDSEGGTGGFVGLELG
jgi:hypothetical protein